MTVKQKKINIWKDLTRYILIYLIVISIPLITKSMLHAGIPVYVLLILPIVKLLFEILPAYNTSKIIKTTCRLLSLIFSVLFAVMLLVSIIITPHSVYVFFFTTVTKTLEQEFFIANLFVLLISFFCLFFGSASLQQKSYKPLLGLISIVFGLLLLIYQTVLYLILMMIGLLIYTWAVFGPAGFVPVLIGVIMGHIFWNE